MFIDLIECRFCHRPLDMEHPDSDWDNWIAPGWIRMETDTQMAAPICPTCASSFAVASNSDGLVQVYPKAG